MLPWVVTIKKNIQNYYYSPLNTTCATRLYTNFTKNRLGSSVTTINPTLNVLVNRVYDALYVQTSHQNIDRQQKIVRQPSLCDNKTKFLSSKINKPSCAACSVHYITVRAVLTLIQCYILRGTLCTQGWYSRSMLILLCNISNNYL